MRSPSPLAEAGGRGGGFMRFLIIAAGIIVRLIFDAVDDVAVCRMNDKRDGEIIMRGFVSNERGKEIRITY